MFGVKGQITMEFIITILLVAVVFLMGLVVFQNRVEMNTLYLSQGRSQEIAFKLARNVNNVYSMDDNSVFIDEFYYEYDDYNAVVGTGIIRVFWEGGSFVDAPLITKNVDWRITDLNGQIFFRKENGKVIVSYGVISAVQEPPSVPTSAYLSGLNHDFDYNGWVRERFDGKWTASGELDWNVDAVADNNAWRDANLVAYWKFNGTAHDYSGNGYTGTVTGASLDVGLWDTNCYYFDGDDYIALPMYYSQSGEIPEVTTCAWFKTTDSGDSYFSNWALIDFDRSEYYNLFVRGDDGRIGFSTKASGIHDFYSSTPGFNDGLWHYACGVYDGTDKKIYIDGRLNNDSSNSHSGANLGSGITRYGFIGDGSEATSFNGSRNNFYYIGSIDELKIWDRALNAKEIENDYNQWINARFVNEDMVDASGTADWNQLKVNTNMNYNFGTELGSTGESWSDGFISLWHMNENTNDSSGNDNNGTWVGSETYAAGLWDTDSASFNASDYVTVNQPSNTTLDVTGALTIEAWIYPTSTRTHGILDNKFEIFSTDGGYALWLLDDHAIVLGIAGPGINNGIKSDTGMFSLNEWTHIVVTRIGSSVKFYVNGDLNDTVSVGSGSIQYDYGVSRYIGARMEARSEYNQGGTARFEGKLEELAVWGKELLAGDVSARYNSGSGVELTGSESDLLAVWHFNGDASDGTSNDNDGIVQGATLTTGLWGTQAYSFDGSQDHIGVNQGLDFSGEFTIGAWIYPTSAREHGLIDNKYEISATDGGYAIWLRDTGEIVFGAGGVLNNSVVTSPAGSFSLNEWSHIVVARSGTDVNFYVNGNQVGTGAIGAGVIYYDEGSGAYLARRTEARTEYGQEGTARFQGYLEDMTAWSRALAAEEVRDLYRKGVASLDLNVYSCSDSACATKTSELYTTGVNNNSWIDISSLTSSQYLGFDALLKQTTGFGGYNAGTFWVSALLSDANITYSS